MRSKVPLNARAAVGMDIPMGIPMDIDYGMGMGTVMNSVGILNGCEIKRKCVKYAINITVSV